MLLRDVASGEVIKQTYQTSNVLAVNAQAQQLISPPTVKSHGNDRNSDGLVDSWNVTVQLRLPQNTQLAGIDLIAAFDYQTSEYVSMQMESLAHLQFQTYSSVPIRSVKTIGSLDFVQTSALAEGMSSQSVRSVYDDNFFNKLATLSGSQLMAEYFRRNETTKYNYGEPIV